MQRENLPKLEKAIVAEIMKSLKNADVGFAVKIHGAAFQLAGLPDIICIAPGCGRFVGLEVKRPVIGRVTTLQQAILAKINAAGGYACVVYSAEDALTALAQAREGVQHA